MPRKILSIASAPGWKARVADEHMLDGVRVVTLVSWALVEGDDGTTEIAGVVNRSANAEFPNGWIGFADEVDGFQGYTFTGLATRASD